MSAATTTARELNASIARKGDPMATRDWHRLIRSSTRGLTDEQVDAAAAICLDRTAFPRGEPSTWHAASIVTGTLDTCNCAPCANARQAQR